jgi:hypothetical protein
MLKPMIESLPLELAPEFEVTAINLPIMLHDVVRNYSKEIGRVLVGVWSLSDGFRTRESP